MEDEEGRVKGPWSPVEDDMLRSFVQAYGAGRWDQIASLIPGRTSKSVRLRWCNQLSPNVVRRPFTAEEDELIIRAHAKLGNKWAVIARMLTGRTDNAVKNHWNSTLRRRLAAAGREDLVLDPDQRPAKSARSGGPRNSDAPSGSGPGFRSNFEFGSGSGSGTRNSDAPSGFGSNFEFGSSSGSGSGSGPRNSDAPSGFGPHFGSNFEFGSGSGSGSGSVSGSGAAFGSGSGSDLFSTGAVYEPFRGPVPPLAAPSSGSGSGSGSRSGSGSDWFSTGGPVYQPFSDPVPPLDAPSGFRYGSGSSSSSRSGSGSDLFSMGGPVYEPFRNPVPPLNAPSGFRSGSSSRSSSGSDRFSTGGPISEPFRDPVPPLDGPVYVPHFDHGPVHEPELGVSTDLNLRGWNKPVQTNEPNPVQVPQQPAQQPPQQPPQQPEGNDNAAAPPLFNPEFWENVQEVIRAEVKNCVEFYYKKSTNLEL